MCQKERGAFRSMAGRKLSAALKGESLADGSCWPRGPSGHTALGGRQSLQNAGPISRGVPARASIVCPSERDQSPVLSVDGCEEDTGHLLTGFTSSPGGKHAVGFPEREAGSQATIHLAHAFCPQERGKTDKVNQSLHRSKSSTRLQGSGRPDSFHL